jgi:hypothetical protein
MPNQIAKKIENGDSWWVSIFLLVSL